MNRGAPFVAQSFQLVAARAFHPRRAREGPDLTALVCGR